MHDLLFAAFDADIAELRQAELRAYFACDEGQAQWFVTEIALLQHVRSIIERGGLFREGD